VRAERTIALADELREMGGISDIVEAGRMGMAPPEVVQALRDIVNATNPVYMITRAREALRALGKEG
jgi:hypothetical protein